MRTKNLEEFIDHAKSIQTHTGSVTEKLLRDLWATAQEAARYELDKVTAPAGLISPVMMNYVPKPWGWELWICNNNRYCGKKLFIKQGRWLSYHHHKIKDEVLFVESGKIRFTHESVDLGEPLSMVLDAGFAYHVTPNMLHQLEAIEDSVVFEFSTQHFDEDSHRKTRDRMAARDVEVSESL